MENSHVCTCKIAFKITLNEKINENNTVFPQKENDGNHS